MSTPITPPLHSHRGATREALATRTFVQLADTLVDDFDLIDLLTVLANRSVELLDAAAAGILLADRSGRLRLMAASDEQVELIELFQIQSEQGPCLDCYSSGSAVIHSDLRGPSPWPEFSVESVRLGFPSVCALPMRIRDNVLGCLNLFLSSPVALPATDVGLARALADVCSVAIMQDTTRKLITTRELQLQHALNSRILIEQAKGMIAEHESVSMDAAFALIRTFARNNNLRLTDIAGNVVEGLVSIDTLRQPRRRATRP